jgi:hypothetical protein
VDKDVQPRGESIFSSNPFCFRVVRACCGSNCLLQVHGNYLGLSANRGESEDNATIDKVTPGLAQRAIRRYSEFAAIRVISGSLTGHFAPCDSRCVPLPSRHDHRPLPR